VTPEVLSYQWRTDTGPLLAERRVIAGLSLLAMSTMGLVALYQIGILKKLPDPPFPGFDANAVHSSREAYAQFALPDAVLGMGSYAVTLALTAAGGKDRVSVQPWLPLALAVKVAFDIIQAGRLLASEVVRQRVLSLWSLIAVGTTVAAGPHAIPEARAALRRLLGA
jgi:hypothetical protein